MLLWLLYEMTAAVSIAKLSQTLSLGPSRLTKANFTVALVQSTQHTKHCINFSQIYHVCKSSGLAEFCAQTPNSITRGTVTMRERQYTKPTVCLYVQDMCQLVQKQYPV